MSYKYEPTKHNKTAVAWLLVILALIVEAVSFAANYSIMFRSFADWPTDYQRGLSFGSAVVIELAVIVLLLGLLYAFESAAQIGIAGFALAVLIFVMAVNFITHGALSRGERLGAFQTHWVQWVGQLSLFIVFATVVALIVLNPDAILRLKERQLLGKVKDARSQAFDQVFESREFEQEMNKRTGEFAKEIAGKVLPVKSDSVSDYTNFPNQ